MKFYRSGVFFQLFATLTLLYITFLFSVSSILPTYTEKFYQKQLTANLSSKAGLIEKLLVDGASDIRSVIHQIGRDLGLHITIYDYDGLVIVDSSGDEDRLADGARLPSEVKRALSGIEESDVRQGLQSNLSVIHLAKPIDSIPGVRVIRLSESIDEVIFWKRIIRLICFAAAVPYFVASYFLYRYFSRRFRYKIALIETFVRSLTSGKSSDPIDESGSDELSALRSKLNRMTDSLSEYIQQIDNEHSKLSLVLKSMSEGVIAFDEFFRIQLINPAAESLLESYPGEALNKQLLEVVKEDAVVELARDCFSEGKLITKEIEMHHLADRVIEVSAAALGDDIGPIRAFLVFKDITEMRRLENLRREFVANVSHELKTPLTSVTGFIETLLAGAYQDEKASQRFLSMMQADTKRLNRLIEDLLQLSALESAGRKLDVENVAGHELAQKVFELLKEKADKKEVRFVNRVDPSHMVLVDRDKFYQVLLNLVDNAVKFSNEGGVVELSSAVKENFIEFTVKDEGQGIPEESLPRIFERFYRVDQARSRALGGTGLGLAITKHIVEAHGGQIRCQSIQGSGSSFIFTLPQG